VPIASETETFQKSRWQYEFAGTISGLLVTRGVSRHLTLLWRHELITPNQVFRNCELLVIGLRLFFGKIDHDDLQVFA
jgi:hypothetical protein